MTTKTMTAPEQRTVNTMFDLCDTLHRNAENVAYQLDDCIDTQRTMLSAMSDADCNVEWALDDAAAAERNLIADLAKFDATLRKLLAQREVLGAMTNRPFTK